MQAGSQISIAVHGETYTMNTVAANFDIHDSRGNDEVWVFGSESNDAAQIWADRAELASSDYQLSFAGSTRYSLIGNGGTDKVTLYDTAGDDVFLGRRDFVVLQSDQVRHLARGFAEVKMQSLLGGFDLGLLEDSAGDDRFVLTPVSALMDYADQASILVSGFDKLQGFALHGGNDVAQVTGSAGNDRLVGRPTATYLESNGAQHLAKGFEAVVAHAGSGGHDVAILYDSPGDDRLAVSADRTVLTGSQFSITVHGFDEVGALGQSGGNNVATFRDTNTNNTFVGMSGLAIMEGVGFRHVAHGYTQVTAVASGGWDRAVLYKGHADHNLLTSHGNVATLSGGGKATTVASFEDLLIVSSPSGAGEGGGVPVLMRSPRCLASSHRWSEVMSTSFPVMPV